MHLIDPTAGKSEEKRTKIMKTETYRIWKAEEYNYEQAYGFIPKITSYLHEDDEKRPCILIVPGGGYCVVSPTEGELVALKFYEKGYQTFVLTYTTNLLQMTPLKMQPLNDISRAVRYIRKNAEQFGVDNHKVAVCGFSAGGHLCGSLCVHYNDVRENNSEYMDISNRPDVAILSYPVITSGERAHRGSFDALLGKDAPESELEYMSLEKHVTEDTPPCFVWSTATDKDVPVENSEMFVQACKEKNVICAFHMFSNGKHGLSLANEDWAKGVHFNPYTVEQLMNVAEKAKEGDFSEPQELLEMFEGSDKQQEVGSPNPEVAVWPELADAFLKGQWG